MEDFGVIVICCDQDYLFAKGVCASVRHFLGDVPICLLIDGDFSVADAQKTYGVKVINRNNIRSEVLKKRSFGWGFTRMIAFWESPFKHFLLVDADVGIMGNIMKHANFKDYDVILDRPCYGYSEEAVSTFFFNIPELEKHFPKFQWRDRPFVCPGVLFGTRDIFSLDEYINLLDFNIKYPDVLRFGDMGTFNFMMFNAADEGRIRLGNADIQLIAPDFEQQEIKKRFPMSQNGPVVEKEDSTVIHWCGPKPTLNTTKTYGDPMTFFRRKFLQDATGKTGAMADAVLKFEDVQRNIYVYQKKIRKKLTGKY